LDTGLLLAITRQTLGRDVISDANDIKLPFFDKRLNRSA